MIAGYRVPGAWYDLSGRISHARAVARCMGDSLPCGIFTEDLRLKVDHLGDLVGAIEDVLSMAQEDFNRMEEEWRRGEVE